MTTDCAGRLESTLLAIVYDDITVKDRDLTGIADDRHQISKPASELTENKPKHLMLCWWYAINIYSITGKRKCGNLPDCFKYIVLGYISREVFI